VLEGSLVLRAAFVFSALALSSHSLGTALVRGNPLMLGEDAPDSQEIIRHGELEAENGITRRQSYAMLSIILLFTPNSSTPELFANCSRTVRPPNCSRTVRPDLRTVRELFDPISEQFANSSTPKNAHAEKTFPFSKRLIEDEQKTSTYSKRLIEKTKTFKFSKSLRIPTEDS
jgi:hypothetical protein